MASLILRAFGGMAPSANAKALDPALAVYAQNLNLRFADFRPLPLPLDLGVPMTEGQTLYRFENSGWFITNPNVVNYVRGPIPNDATERTYYTGDGAPKVVNHFNDVRLLGVPRPAAAPGVTVNVTDEYSEDDVVAAQAAALATFTNVVWANCDSPYVGLSDTELAAKFVSGPAGAPWMYSFVIAGTMSDGMFTPTTRAHQNLIDDRLGFHIGPAGAGTAGWVDVTVRGATVTLKPGLSAALQAIKDPSDPAGVRNLMTAAQAATVITNLNNERKATDNARDAALERMRVLQAEFIKLADTSSAVGPATKGAILQFYQRADVIAQNNQFIESTALAILGAVRTYREPIDNPYTHDVS